VGVGVGAGNGMEDYRAALAQRGFVVV